MTERKYTDIVGNIIPEEERDYEEEFGYWDSHLEKGEYHEGIPAIQEQGHYKVVCVHFMDNSFYEPLSEQDMHIKTIDAEHGEFNYVFLNGEERKEIKNIDIEYVIDTPYKPHTPGYYDDIWVYVYHPYTEEQLAAIEAERVAQEKRQYMLDTGADRLSDAESIIEDLTLAIAEIIGMEEEVEE